MNGARRGRGSRPLPAPPGAFPGGPEHTDGIPRAAARRARGGHNPPSVRSPQVGQGAGHTCAAQMVSPAAAGTGAPPGTGRWGGRERGPAPGGGSFRSLESGEGATEKMASSEGGRTKPRPRCICAPPPRPGPSGLTRPPCCKGVCPFVPFGNLNAQHQGTEKEMCASLLPRSDKQPWKKYATEESQVPKQYIQHNPTLGSKVEFGLHRLGALQAWSGHFVFSKLGSLISSMAF